MQLPKPLLPEILDELEPQELRERAVATARLIDRSYYDLGRALNRIDEIGPEKLGCASALDFAEAHLGLNRRSAYHLIRVDLMTRDLPRFRAAYAKGEVSYTNARLAVAVAAPEDEEAWLEKARTLPSRALAAEVRRVAHGRAESGEAPWPETGLYGELGRPEERLKLKRPYTTSLHELESRVWELHNRVHASDTSWAELMEAALVSYQQELELALSSLAPEVREVLDRDGWRCGAPGCSRRTVEHHHVIHRSQGGTGDPDGLAPLCRSHHDAHHDGLLEVTGTASLGFRFRYRSSVFEAWQEFPAAADAAERPDPHDTAWDIDDGDALARGAESDPLSWPVAAARARRADSCRSPRPRYGGRALECVTRERAFRALAPRAGAGGGRGGLAARPPASL
jgi:hypothetical protein